MYGSLNKIILIGSLSKDPEIRYTDSGIAVCNFNIGVRERKKINNEWIPHTEWFKIVCFGDLAQNAEKYLKKGAQVYIEGKIQLKTWEYNNKTSYSFDVIANKLIFLNNNFKKDLNLNQEENFVNKNENTHKEKKEIDSFEDDNNYLF